MNNHTIADFMILMRMLKGSSGSGNHQEQMDQFYRPQAQHYDNFRQRLLHGRQQLLQSMNIMPDQYLVELGGGTGYNLGYLEYPLQTYRRIDIVDICPSLLEVARERYADNANIEIIPGDATLYQPPEAADRVWFSYALSMIPDWRAAIDNAIAMLKPGGMLGVVDFYVSNRRVTPPGVQHGPVPRAFWRHWFAHDGVSLDPAHLDYLRERTHMVDLQECSGRVPYLPLLRAPYYIYVGQAR